MSRHRELVRACFVAASILLLLPAPSVALGPDTGKGGMSGPLGSGAVKPAPAKALPAAPLQGVAPKATPPTQVAAPPASGKPGALPAEPKWPQNFELGTGERTGFGFVAGKPGPIVVTVKWKGAPLVVSLVKPGGGTVERQGNGGVTIEYTATADDVKKGMLWGISLRPAQEGSKPAGGTGIQVETKPVKRPYQVLAKGTVGVQHPPGDMKLAQAELGARVAKARAVQSNYPPPAAQVDFAAQKQEALEKLQAARQTRQQEQVKGKDASTASPAGGGAGTIAPPAKGGAVSSKPSATASAAPDPVSANDPPTIPPPRKVNPPNIKSAWENGTSHTQGSSPGDGGSNPPAAVAPGPVINYLSQSGGQPGEQVLITGNGFSRTRGEVHFVIGPRPVDDRIAEVVSSFGTRYIENNGWNDKQIVVKVPYVVGVMGFNGYVYVRLKQGSTPTVHDSNRASFLFDPLQEYRTLFPDLRSSSDSLIRDPRMLLSERMIFHGDYTIYNLLFGGKGDDWYFRTRRLKNGWVADSAVIDPGGGAMIDPGYSDAYIAEFRAGTNLPYLKVHWWYIPESHGVILAPRVVIRGPKGVPHE